MSNGQVFIQKTDGWFQFYVQAGGYMLTSLGTPYLGTNNTLTNTYGPVPVGFVPPARNDPRPIAGPRPRRDGAAR